MVRFPPALQFAVLTLGWLVGGVPCHSTCAQNAGATAPVGLLTVPLPAQSDTRVSLPFLRTARYDGTVQAVSGNVVTVGGSPGWTANQFVPNAAANQPDTFFALLGSNSATGTPKEGCFYTVTGNDANTVTLNLNGDDLSTVQPGTRVTLIPYWTLGTAFPASDAGNSFLASASPSSRATLIFPTEVQEISTVGGVVGGQKQPPPLSYYFYNGAWRSSQDDPSVDYGDTVLYPDGHFIVRNTAATALAFHPVGTVLAGKLAVPVPTSGDGVTLFDCPVGLPRPLDVTLNASGLVDSGIVQDSGGDTVQVFGLGTTGYNQAAAALYYFSNGAWRMSGASGTQDFGAALLPAGAGWIIQKASGDGSTVFWQNTPNYSVGH